MASLLRDRAHIASGSFRTMGMIVAPCPESLEDVITHVVARALDLFGLEVAIPRWGEDE